ncbi:MAG TPA: glycoside hydrolase family 2 TIM barrel-domain containing protein [Solirubrobacteraceae bacterium]|nr:glycoside hydrolase family 2 TIM barrel-domain containing protein [Solirubrobacteraceae bacterium]
MRIARPLALTLALLGGLLAWASPALAQDGVTRGTIYKDGPDNRYLLGGGWLFRLDTSGVGQRDRFQRQTTTDGWTATTVPNAWNVGDNSVASMTGTTAWYRKDFRLPDARSRMDWLVRFESVNYRSTVWLNGTPIGRNTGAYLPWDLRLPRSVLKRNGVNRLVIRVDNRRLRTDFPPSGLTGSGDPAGGWWNYGGMLREVYLQRVDRIDISSVVVRPDLPCSTCDASVLARITVRNYGDDSSRVRITGSFGGQRFSFRSKSVGSRDFAAFEARVTVRNPRLWSPASPQLYDVRFNVRSGDRKVVGYSLHSGVRSIKVVNGRLQLNGRDVSLRGVGLHEDDPAAGFAIGSARRAQIIAQARELGATVIRSHYPLHPEMHELADQQGLLVWSEIPVYAVKTQYLKRLAVRKLAARELEANILANQNHPSIMLWSIGNELSSRPGPVQQNYIERAARQAKALDPSRPIALAIAGYPSAGCRPQYAALDVIGINDYFGWYPGPNGQIADRDALPEFLDGMRACYPTKALFVSEFGAEANRNGPVEEKGTFEFQQDFVNYHLAVHSSKPWLSGSIYWALQEFRVRPNWDGGNPLPNSPIHEKGLLRFDGTKKPAWFDVERQFKATPQLGS